MAWQPNHSEKIGEELIDNRPCWVPASIPIEWQTDQFLHAYYYNQVSDGLKNPYEDFYQLNKNNPQLALTNAVCWWKDTTNPPSNEDHTFNESAPYIQEKLDKKNILNLTPDEFSQVC